jgi:hypothetical protein
LTGFFLIKTPVSSEYLILAIFSMGIDALPLEQKTGSPDCQTEAESGFE